MCPLWRLSTGSKIRYKAGESAVFSLLSKEVRYERSIVHAGIPAHRGFDAGSHLGGGGGGTFPQENPAEKSWGAGFSGLILPVCKEASIEGLIAGCGEPLLVFLKVQRSNLG